MKSPLPPLPLGEKTTGQRLARFRKERGYTQAEIAEKIGISQRLVSEYETARLHMNDQMLTRFAMALEVSADSILGIASDEQRDVKPTLKILRRLARIDSLSLSEQKTLLKTIDMFLKAAGK